MHHDVCRECIASWANGFNGRLQNSHKLYNAACHLSEMKYFPRDFLFSFFNNDLVLLVAPITHPLPCKWIFKIRTNYIHICICMYVFVYIYILCVCVYIYDYIYIYMCLYIYSYSGIHTFYFGFFPLDLWPCKTLWSDSCYPNDLWRVGCTSSCRVIVGSSPPSLRHILWFIWPPELGAGCNSPVTFERGVRRLLFRGIC